MNYQQAKYITDSNGNPTDVVIPIDVWRQIQSQENQVETKENEMETGKITTLPLSLLKKAVVLMDNCGDLEETEQIFSQMIKIILADHRQKLTIYEQDISKFEQTYGLNSDQFIQQFEAGTLGDNMDFFEWFGLFELRQEILGKIGKLEKYLR